MRLLFEGGYYSGCGYYYKYGIHNTCSSRVTLATSAVNCSADARRSTRMRLRVNAHDHNHVESIEEERGRKRKKEEERASFIILVSFQTCILYIDWYQGSCKVDGTLA